MSIETLMAQHIEALNANTAVLNLLLENGGAASQTVASSTTRSENQTATETNTGEKKETSSARVAQRKTYVFDKDTKTGQIVAKGEAIPTGDNFVCVKQPKWLEACEKYGLDPETGSALSEETEKESAEEESLGDDGLGLDDDEDLGLDDDEPTIDAEDVRAKLVAVAKGVGREVALKIMKKHDATNFNDIKPEHYNAVFKAATDALEG